MHHIFRKSLFALAAFTVSAVGAFAQSHTHNIKCATDIMTERALLANPSLAIERQELEEFTQEFVAAKQTDKNNHTQIVVPVVFHIIHNDGNERISYEQVVDGLRILNLGFNFGLSDTTQIVAAFKNRQGNVKVEFRLATKDPNGNCTRGVTYTKSALTDAANDNVKDLISWPRDKYLNVWVVKNISLSGAPTGGTILGYAYQPGNAPQPTYDGVEILSTCVGNVGNAANSSLSEVRTLIHEVGHWFNLSHTWGSGPVATTCNGNDNVADTPPTDGTFGGCPLSYSPCSGQLANVQNHMDYAECPRMFTNGQVDRMRAALNSSTGSRNNLWTAANLLATGTNTTSGPICPPIVELSTYSKRICQGNNQQIGYFFYNAPANTVDLRLVLDGPTRDTIPALATDNSVFVNFRGDGPYKVKMIASNSAGLDSVVGSETVYSYGSAHSFSANYIESFESPTFPIISTTDLRRNWSIDKSTPTATQTWAVVQTPGANDGGYALRIRNNAIVAGSVNTLITPMVDLSTLTTPVFVRYRIAHAQRNTSNTDRLRMLTSSDCGQTFRFRLIRDNATTPTLATTSPTTTNYIPVAADWREESFNLTSIINAGTTKLLFSFEMTSNGGNNLYLDYVRITDANGVSIPLQVAGNTEKLNVMPNPANTDQAIISYLASEGETADITITDMTGKTVGSSTMLSGTGKLQEIYVSGIAPKLSKGVYLVHLKTESTLSTKKLIIE